MAVVGFCLAISSSFIHNIDSSSSSSGGDCVRNCGRGSDWWVVALITATLVFICETADPIKFLSLKRLINSSETNNNNNNNTAAAGLHSALGLAIAVVAAARIATVPMVLGAALLVPCGALFPFSYNPWIRTIVVCLALLSGGLCFFLVLPASQPAGEEPGEKRPGTGGGAWYFCYIRLALAIHLMMMTSSSSSQRHHHHQIIPSKTAVRNSSRISNIMAWSTQNIAERGAGVLFSAMVVLMLAYSVDPMRMIHFWGWGLYPAIMISMNRPLMLPMMMVDDDGHDHNNSGCSAKRPYGPWGVYALAASTAIGLCAIKDEGLELFLLISHFVIHLADINNNNRQSPAATTAIMPLIIMHHTKPTAQRSNTASHFDAPPAHQHQSSSVPNLRFFSASVATARQQPKEK